MPTNRCYSVSPPDVLVDTPVTGRVTAGLIGRWDFNETTGSTVQDTSGVAPALDLQISGPVVRFSGAVRFDASDAAIATSGAATKIINAASASNQITVEAWFKPANVVQTGPARIVSCSDGALMRNFHLAQDATNLEARIRNTVTGVDGSTPVLMGGTLVDTTPSHAILLHRANGDRLVYLNGSVVASDGTGGALSNWSGTYPLLFGNETTLDRDWLGELYLVAIYDRALTDPEITRNYVAGADAP